MEDHVWVPMVMDTLVGVTDVPVDLSVIRMSVMLRATSPVLSNLSTAVPVLPEQDSTVSDALG